MTEATPIVMVGAAGRMGQAILRCAGESEYPYELIAAVESPDHPAVGTDLRAILPAAPPGSLLLGEMPPAPPRGTVAIVFALPEPTLERLAWCEATASAAVIGTTGFTEAQVEDIRRAARRVPVVFAPNMSVGVNVLCEIAKLATELLGEDFDVEISEMHHRFKKDAPSGTAKRLAEVVLEARGGSYSRDVRHGRDGLPGERTREELGMHCMRGGDVVGDHTVHFVAMGERIELTHRAHSRDTFARGALRAATWVRNKPAGLYGMKDVLGL